MSVKDKFTALADGFRAVYNSSDKYSFDDMTKRVYWLSLQGLLNLNNYSFSQASLNNGVITFDSQGELPQHHDLNFVAQKFGQSQKVYDIDYVLEFEAHGTGSVKTYFFGTTSSGSYVDNGHQWQLTSDWKKYTQEIAAASVPVKNAQFNFRADSICSGKLRNLRIIPK